MKVIIINTFQSKSTICKDEQICYKCNRLRHISKLRQNYSTSWSCIEPCIKFTKDFERIVLHKYKKSQLANFQFMPIPRGVRISCSKCKQSRYKKNLIKISNNSYVCKEH